MCRAKEVIISNKWASCNKILACIFSLFWKGTLNRWFIYVDTLLLIVLLFFQVCYIKQIKYCIYWIPSSQISMEISFKLPLPVPTLNDSFQTMVSNNQINRGHYRTTREQNCVYYNWSVTSKFGQKNHWSQGAL